MIVNRSRDRKKKKKARKRKKRSRRIAQFVGEMGSKKEATDGQKKAGSLAVRKGIKKVTKEKKKKEK